MFTQMTFIGDILRSIVARCRLRKHFHDFDGFLRKTVAPRGLPNIEKLRKILYDHLR